jgi:hypothetical protein
MRAPNWSERDYIPHPHPSRIPHPRLEQQTGSIRGLIHQFRLQRDHAAPSLCGKQSAMASDAAAARAPAVRT